MEKGLYNVRTLEAELATRGIKLEDADFRITDKGKIFLVVGNDILWTGDKTTDAIKAKKVKPKDLFVGESDWKDEDGDAHTSTNIFYNPLLGAAKFKFDE